MPRRRSCCAWLAWLALLAAAAAPAAAEILESSPRRTAIVAAVEQAASSVVNIHGRKMLRREGPQRENETYRPVNGMGTGVVIDERGYIVTNYHVVQGVGRIKVTLSADESPLIARLVNHDPRTDLAIIKVDAARTLPVLEIGTSSDLMPGETVIAVGNAYGYQHTVTRGIISALHRTVPVTDEQTYHDLIQTDASINPGNSGGPLLNVEGNMIGINVAMRVGAQGIGFALPIDEAMEVIAKLMSVERLSGFSHGVAGRTVVGADNSQFVVRDVRAGTPAADSGLQPGDVVEQVAGVDVHRELDFERALIGRSPGDKVPVSVERDGQRHDLTLTLASAPAVADKSSPSLAGRIWTEVGLRVQVASTAEQPLRGSNYSGGLQVTEVRGGSPAQREGIRPGDILVGMHRWETASLNDIAYILSSREFHQQQPAKFFILRGQDVLFGYLNVAGETARAHYAP